MLTNWWTGVLKYKRQSEELLMQSGLAYTILRPGRLTDGPYTSFDLNTLLQATAGTRQDIQVAARDELNGETSRIALAGMLLMLDSYVYQASIRSHELGPCQQRLSGCCVLPSLHNPACLALMHVLLFLCLRHIALNATISAALKTLHLLQFPGLQSFAQLGKAHILF